MSLLSDYVNEKDVSSYMKQYNVTREVAIKDILKIINSLSESSKEDSNDSIL